MRLFALTLAVSRKRAREAQTSAIKVKEFKSCDIWTRCGRKQITTGRLFVLLIIITIAVAGASHAAEKIRIAYPAVAPGSTPSWITVEKGIWRKYGFDAETILVSGGARAVPALVGQSVQFVIGSDTGVTTAMLQGIPLVRLGVTMNTLGSALV